MHMGIVEARKQEFALRIDNFGLRSVSGIDFGGTPYRDNPVAKHCQRFRLWTAFIAGPDSGIGHDEISGGAGLRHTSGAHRE